MEEIKNESIITDGIASGLEDVDINEYYWGMNSKIRLYIGLKNFVDDSYPEIIWFKQGLYLLTTFITSTIHKFIINNFFCAIKRRKKFVNGVIAIKTNTRT